MENFATIGETQFSQLVKEETKKAHHDNTTCVTQHAFNTSYHNVLEHNVYEMIPKREYGILLKQLEEWGVAYPKAVCKKHGVRTVQRAVAYVKGTPNVKNKGAYFTFMVRQLKKVDNEQQPIQPEEPKQQIQQVSEPNTLAEKPQKKEGHIESPKMPQIERKKKKGINNLPSITKWQEAREFLFKIDEYDLDDVNVLEFARKIKKKYNFA